MTPLTGQELRRLTRQSIGAHGGGKIGDLFTDVYAFIFGLVIALLLLIGLFEEVSLSVRSAPDSRIETAWMAWAVLILSLGAGLALAGRFGPLFLGGGYGAWWLLTPADRRGLLRPRLFAIVGLAVVVGLVAGIPVASLFGGLSAETLASIGLAMALVVLAASAGQTRTPLGTPLPPPRVPMAAKVGDGLVAVSVIPILLGLMLPETASVQMEGNLWSVGVLAVGVLVATSAQERTLERVSGADLRTRGMIATSIESSAVSLDTRELGRLLAASGTNARSSRHKSARFGWVKSAPIAVVTSELVHLLRTPRHLVQFSIGAVVPMIAAWAGWPAWVVLIAVLAGGALAVSALGGPARDAYIAPVLDGMWPLSARRVRWLRTALPSLAMGAWLTVVLAVSTNFAPVAGLGFSLAAAPAFAAGMIRAAYRKPVDWSAPLITAPDGLSIPPGAFSIVTVGPDVVIFGGLPLWLAIGALGPTPLLLAVQIVTSAIALAIATRLGRGPHQLPKGET